MTNDAESDTGKETRWHKALAPDELPEGRVTAVTLGGTTVCLTHFRGRYAAIDNACPHQGGPLGEGSIENGLLRCPWHGWDFDPLTGESPGAHDDCVLVYDVEEREDGIYVAIPVEHDRERTVSDVMVETMTAWGVSQVWGIVGHSNLGLADAFREAETREELTYYGVRHEGAAAFAASAYGKLTGEPAACFSIAGPGATNLLTGLWDANVDRSPTLALTGQVATQVLGTGNFQEVDLEAAYGDVALFEQTVLPNSDHAELMTRAVKTALLEGGVSHLVFPDEVQTLPSEVAAGGPEGRITRRDIAPPDDSVAEAVELLSRADRPLIIVGYGARFHMEPVVTLAEALNCPVVTTFKAKGQLSDHHPLAGGVLGRSGTPVASHFMNESDLLLVFGASFSNHTGISEYKPTVHVDHDPMVLGKHHPVDVPVWGDVGVTVDRLRDCLDAAGVETEDQREEIAERWAIWRDEKATRRSQPPERGVNYATTFDAMSRLLPEDAILPVDVGNNTYAFGRYFECVDHTVLMSGYLGSIGFALPAALGAWAATRERASLHRGRPVVSVSSDGGFGQYMAELTTAVKYDMDLTHVLLNDDELGKISKEQRDGGWPVWQTDLVNPDFAAYAESCGARGVRVENPDELEAALEEGLAHDGPALVEVLTDANPV